MKTVKISEQNIHGLSITILGSAEHEKNTLFIHGGPGLNAQTLIEYALETQIFLPLNANIIFYDQRNCGKSKESEINNNYKQQIIDLNTIVLALKETHKLSAIIGHSYGAKLLSDYRKEYNEYSIPSVILASSSDITTPRLNNIKLDLDYLMESDKMLYQETIKEIASSSIWEITEKLNSTFVKNPKRTERYWFNKDIMKEYLEFGKNIQFPINNEAFTNLRKELYTSTDTAVEINKPNTWHFIGYQDYIMLGHQHLPSPKTKIFYESSHYPHIEEPALFCKELNEII